MKLLQQLMEAKTPWARLNAAAREQFGEFGFATLESDDAESLIFMKGADKLAQEEGEFGFMTLDESDMKRIINAHPELLKKTVK